MSARPPETFWVRKSDEYMHSSALDAWATIPDADGDGSRNEKIAGPVYSRRRLVRRARRRLKRLHRLYNKATRYYVDKDGGKMVPDTYGLTKELDR